MSFAETPAGLSVGVIARSRKESERRLAIHRLHLKRIDADPRERVYLEHGYGELFGAADEQLRPYVAGLRTRAELFAECDVIICRSRSRSRRTSRRCETGKSWGWPHCVQDAKITQLSIEKRLTLIDFEAMNYWSADGSFSLHVFHKNDEMARYCSVIHALELAGRQANMTAGSGQP